MKVVALIGMACHSPNVLAMENYLQRSCAAHFSMPLSQGDPDNADGQPANLALNRSFPAHVADLPHFSVLI